MHVLKVGTGPAPGQTYEIDKETVVGREGADVNVVASGISRRHAMLRPTGEGVVVEDLGSLKGTFVNGERIAGPTLVTGTATLGLGAASLTLEPAAETAVAARAVPSAERVPPPASAAPPPPRRTPTGRTMFALGALLAALVAGAVVAVVALTGGGGSAAAIHTFDVDGVVAVVEQTGKPGAPGFTQVEAAKVSGVRAGKGAGILRARLGARAAWTALRSSTTAKGA